MDNNKEEQSKQQYDRVKKRYLYLKQINKWKWSNSCNTLSSQSSILLSSQSITKNNRSNNKLNSKSITQKIKKYPIHLSRPIEHQRKSFQEYLEELNQTFKGDQNKFYQKYKNNINGLKFLKFQLFAKLNKISIQDESNNNNNNISQFMEESQKLKQKNNKAMNKTNNIIILFHRSGVWILLFLSLMMFAYNIYHNIQEIIQEKKTILNYREQYLNESDALYELQKEKYILSQRQQRHKNTPQLLSILNKSIQFSYSFIFGVLFLFAAFFKRIFYPYNIYERLNKKNPITLFSNLPVNSLKKNNNDSIKHLNKVEVEEIQQQIDNKIEENNNNDNNNNTHNNTFCSISEAYEQNKRIQEEKFLAIFNEQKEYIIKRKEEENIKRELLEMKKQEMMKELQYLDYQNKRNAHLKKKRNEQQQQNFKSFSHYNQYDQKNNQENEQPIQFISQYYNYEKIHASEDEDYDLPNFAQNKQNPLLNKFKKRSQILIKNNNLSHSSNLLQLPHYRSKSIGPTFNILNYTNHTQPYQFCDRPY